MLLLEDLLPAPPPPDDVRPLLENDVRREGGPDSPSVAAAVLLGESERGIASVPRAVVVVVAAAAGPRFSDGISAHTRRVSDIRRATMPIRRITGQRKALTFDLVRLGVVAHIGSLRFRDLHLAVFLRLRQREVLFVP